MINFSFPFRIEIRNTKPSTISLFAALGFVVIHLEYSDFALCYPLSYVDNMYKYTGKVLEAGSHICVN
jgi:hypothetical protein